MLLAGRLEGAWSAGSRHVGASRQITSVTPADVSGASWSFLGPQPIENGEGLSFEGFCAGLPRITVSGRVTSLAFGPDTSTIYIGSAGGGVWKSSDAGASWTALTDGEPSMEIGALAVVPGANTSQDVVYAGTGKSDATCEMNFGQGILKSTDGGQTWAQLGAITFDGLSFTRIAVASNPTVLYAGTETAFIGFAAGQCLLPEATNAGLFKSSDGGQSWAMLSGNGGLPAAGADPGAATDVVIDPTNDASVYAAIQGTPPNTSGGVWKSTDAGATWSQLSGGLPSGANRISLSISPDGTTLYAARADSTSDFDAVYRSTDRGATWSMGGKLKTDSFCLPETQPYYGLVVQ